MKTFNASLTNLADLLPHSYDCGCNTSKRRLIDSSLWPKKHTTSSALLACDISLSSLILPALKAGEFVEILLFYITSKLCSVMSRKRAVP